METPEPLHEPHAELASLRDLGRLRETPFHSDVPVIGPLIAAFRTAWNSVATLWYVRPIMAQQTTFNESVVDELIGIRAAAAESQAALEVLQDELDKRLLALDEDHVNLTRDLGEATVALAQVHRALEALESRLARLEEGAS